MLPYQKVLPYAFGSVLNQLINCYTYTHRLNADWLLRYTCHPAKFASKLKYFNSSEFVGAQILVNTLACSGRKCGATNLNLSPVFSSEYFAIHFVWDLVAPSRLV